MRTTHAHERLHSCCPSTPTSSPFPDCSNHARTPPVAQHKFSEAKGGGFMFYSKDERYMIKTIEWEEKAALLSMLPDLCQHMHSFPRSLVCRISGCYELTVASQLH